MRMGTGICLLLIVFAGCDNAPPVKMLRSTSMQIGREKFTIEIADNDPDREHGLMQRDSMPADHGMIFIFPEERPQAFWMKNTRFPLDIAYIDSTGKVDSIKQMKPYDLTGVPSEGAIKYAIELNL